MKIFCIITMVNGIVTLLIAALMRKLYRGSVNLGTVRVKYRLSTIKNVGIRALLHKYIYLLYAEYEGREIGITVSREEYERLGRSQRETIPVTLRRFPSKWLSPDLCEYDMAFEETDWETKDESRIRKGTVFVFLAVELITACMIFQV